MNGDMTDEEHQAAVNLARIAIAHAEKVRRGQIKATFENEQVAPGVTRVPADCDNVPSDDVSTLQGSATH